jgi:hypothetical protein
MYGVVLFHSCWGGPSNNVNTEQRQQHENGFRTPRRPSEGMGLSS